LPIIDPKYFINKSSYETDNRGAEDENFIEASRSIMTEVGGFE